MNLHVLPDSKFSQVFIQHIQRLNLSSTNRFVVRSNAAKLTHVDSSFPFAKAGSHPFRKLVGDTLQYDKVFIHNFSPVLYPWVATSSFRELSWMMWGADVYGLSFVKYSFLEKETRNLYKENRGSLSNWLYELKVKLVAARFRERAYSKVNKVLTWMKGEHQFAQEHISSLHASHEFFFYANQQSYEQLPTVVEIATSEKPKTYIVGNSGYPVNNHLDALEAVQRLGREVQLKVPVSYGDPHYIKLLRKACEERGYGNVAFIDQYMSGADYIQFLSEADGLIMNTIRPQGYGNILMMMAMGKPVFMNSRNVSLNDLVDMGIQPLLIDQVGESVPSGQLQKTAAIVKAYFSQQRLDERYTSLFS